MFHWNKHTSRIFYTNISCCKFYTSITLIVLYMTYSFYQSLEFNEIVFNETSTNWIAAHRNVFSKDSYCSWNYYIYIWILCSNDALNAYFFFKTGSKPRLSQHSIFCRKVFKQTIYIKKIFSQNSSLCYNKNVK